MKRIRFRCVLLASAVAWVLTILPVSAEVVISSFNAKWESGKVLVRWTTSSEHNNAGFNILRSTALNGTFTKVYNTAAQFGNIAGASYSFTDSAVTAGQTYYYRLQSINTSGGTETYSGTAIAIYTPPPPNQWKYFLPVLSKQCAGIATIDLFYADKPNIVAGYFSKLIWSQASNADSVSIDNGIGEVATPGTTFVSPSISTTYALTARCGTNDTVRQVTIKVWSPDEWHANPPGCEHADQVFVKAKVYGDRYNPDSGVAGLRVVLGDGGGNRSDIPPVTTEWDGTYAFTLSAVGQSPFKGTVYVWLIDGYGFRISDIGGPIVFNGLGPDISGSCWHGWVDFWGQ